MIKHGPVLEVDCWKVGLVPIQMCALEMWGGPEAAGQHLWMLYTLHPASPDAAPAPSSISECCTRPIQHLRMLYPPHPQPLLAGPGCSVLGQWPRLVSWECDPHSYVHTEAPSLQGLQAVAVGILRSWTWNPSSYFALMLIAGPARALVSTCIPWLLPAPASSQEAT